MTEEYKENVLKYLTNNLLDQTGTQEPIYRSITAENSNLYTNVHNYYQSLVVYIDFIPSKDNQTTNYSILAVNGQLIGQSDVSGALFILDDEYNVVDYITHYQLGNSTYIIPIISCINVDDNGNYYLVAGGNILALNNIAVKPVGSNTHKAICSGKYDISQFATWDNITRVYRNSNADEYLVVGVNNDNSIRCGVYDVNNPDYSNYYYSQALIGLDTTYKMFSNSYNVYWDNDGEVQIQIVAYSDTGKHLYLFEKQPDKKYFKQTELLQSELVNENDIFNNFDFVFYSNKIGIYVESFIHEHTNPITGDVFYTYPYRIYKVDIENNTTTLLKTDIFQSASLVSSGKLCFQIWFIRKDNKVFYYDFGLIGGTNHFSAYIGVVDVENETAFEEQTLGTFDESVFLYAWLYPNIIDDFNNATIKLVNQTKLFTANITWNPSAYTGLPYESIGSLVPQYATIEDENEIELFDRNLYNLTAYSNGYNATIQIPNNYLNGVQLANANLYSQNNNLLVGNPINTTKNQYEEVFVNFINRFNVLDENEFNIDASSGLVNAMLTKSATGHLGKIKINYNDNTSEIKILGTSDLVYTQLASGVKTTLKIVVYASKLIDNIELISEDETISYSTIDCGDMELNKYYLITQDVRID